MAADVLRLGPGHSHHRQCYSLYQGREGKLEKVFSLSVGSINPSAVTMVPLESSSLPEVDSVIIFARVSGREDGAEYETRWKETRLWINLNNGANIYYARAFVIYGYDLRVLTNRFWKRGYRIQNSRTRSTFWSHRRPHHTAPPTAKQKKVTM